MPNPPVGHVDCWLCGEPAEVRQDRKGKLYIVCDGPDCGRQDWPRGAPAQAKLKQKMRPVAASKVEPEKPVPETPTPAAPEKKPGAFGNWLGL